VWIVRLALRRPYTVAVLAALMLLSGSLSTLRMQKDIFPNIDIPVVAVVWSYPGLAAEDMERRVVLISERAYSTTVNGIERIESQSIPGVGLLRIYFQPGTEIGAAISQISSVSSTILRILPPGFTPPSVIQFNASNVPVAQLDLSSQTLPEQELFDYGLNFVRVRLFTIPGLSSPAPFGGKQRQINIDLDPQRLAAKGLSAADVVNALQTGNVILPAGTARIGSLEYNVETNSSPSRLDEMARIPVRIFDGQPITVGDVAQVTDSYATQSNIVHIDGRRATYLAILKHSDASTLAVVEATREAMPAIQAVAPHGMEFKIAFDQSLFVRGAINAVLREAVIASVLVSLMILAFLGSWRSVMLVSTSIPLAILTAIFGLYAFGQTLNVLTLGGLALAIGMLVDDATVEVENINRNHDLGKPLTVAILDGARQVATPAIVATLSICIVFFPVVLLQGPAKFLFTPLALSVVLAMLTSYLLSRTLVPVLARRLLPEQPVEPGRIGRLRERGFAKLVEAYGAVLDVVLAHRITATLVAVLFVALSAPLAFFVGSDFYPRVDAGQMKLHVRARAGLRIEDTEKVVLDVERAIRQIIPPGEVDAINDMIGVPLFYNLAFVPTDNVGGMDAEIRIALQPKHHATEGYMRTLREELPRRFPGVDFYFMPADIVTQVLSFGVPAPIDVQIEGDNLKKSYAVAIQLRDELRRIPGTADVHVRQLIDYPALRVDIDRLRAGQFGVAQRDVATSLLSSLASSALLSPSYYLNPANNVNYIVAVRQPIERLTSVPQLMALPVSPPSALAVAPATEVVTNEPQGVITLGNLATVRPGVEPSEIDHYTVQRVIDVAGDTDGRDLGAVASDIEKKIVALGKLPPGMRIRLRGQYQVMHDSFTSMGVGLILAVVLVYLLMVVLFQSFLDPFLILLAVPGALAGILWMLAITGTTLNVQSLMGAIMAVGIAVSNSILLISFANDARFEGDRERGATEAVSLAARTRLRPVLMTALAMILGMLPMALGIGEAGEQNAPLGRAVIGGLLLATLMTLLLVPVGYSLLRKRPPTRHLLDEKFKRESQGAGK
jgi:multidrug efflux pump subunit AcrB